MLLTLRFAAPERKDFSWFKDGEAEQIEEFWFGRGLAWSGVEEGSAVLRLSLAVDVPRVVARTKRRDREEHSSVGFCDSYPYTASGLLGLFLARLRKGVSAQVAGRLEGELLCYPERPHGADIARRLFLPAGYEVNAGEGRLRIEASKSLGQALNELPVLLLALDRRTRLFLSAEELTEIGGENAGWVRLHPAVRAIELTLSGRPTPLRQLLAPGAVAPIRGDEPEGPREYFQGVFENVTGAGKCAVSQSQKEHALSVLSRVNIDPNWLIYLPAGVASVQASTNGIEIERPEEALKYFRDEQIEKVVVEEKHMGSRAIVILCRTLEAARKRFGVDSEIPGCAYTRNGRRFFPDEDAQAVFLERLGEVLSRAHFWKRFSTDWVCFDGEILPWAVKASASPEESDLVEAGTLVVAQTLQALDQKPGFTLQAYWKEALERELSGLRAYDSMFKRYRTENADLSALKFAPFHLLAVEGQTFFSRSHLWQMETIKRLSRSGEGFVIPTRYEVVSTADARTWTRTLGWWEELSNDFSEGLVVKPLPFVPRGRRGLAQPALKCRSREHLRLVYGPRYDSQDANEALVARDALRRRRNKHRRILRQFALSLEAVDGFVKRNPLDAVHECVLGVLAQEVAPRMNT